MISVAHSRFQRVSPRKLAQVLAVVRGKRVDEALRMLQFVPKSAKPIVEKALLSALANAGKGYKSEQLIIQRSWVTQGTPLKRMRAGSMGRSMPYKRRTANITIELDTVIK